MDDGSFYFEPEVDSGVFPRLVRTEAEARAAHARAVALSDVAVMLDLAGREATLGVVGSPIELSDEKQAVLMAWLQEVEGRAVRPTPPKLALAFGCHELFVLPVQSPATVLGVLAVTLPCFARRAAFALETLAAEFALELEARERTALRTKFERSQADTLPAPAWTVRAPPRLDVPEPRVLRAGRW